MTQVLKRPAGERSVDDRGSGRDSVARGLTTAGERGGVRLAVGVRAGRTRITDLECRPPLQILRLHYLDPSAPDLATAILASPSGGILDGDAIHLEVSVGPGARLHVGTQSATRIYRTPGAGAQFNVDIKVADGGYLEVMPDPYIPYRASRFETKMRCEVAERGTLVVREVVGPGRAARGEILAFESFESRLELMRPDGEVFATDTVRLDPLDGLDSVGLIGRYRCVGSLFVVQPGFSPDVLLAGAATVAATAATVAAGAATVAAGAATISPADLNPDPAVADPAMADSDEAATWGASGLPAASGAWIRVLARDPGMAEAILYGAWAAARAVLVGAAPPPNHRF